MRVLLHYNIIYNICIFIYAMFAAFNILISSTYERSDREIKRGEEACSH